MKMRMLTLLVALACWLTPATTASAASKEDEETARQEARLEGYATSVHVPGAAVGMAWQWSAGYRDRSRHCSRTRGGRIWISF
jgi:hypothetical protein